MISFPLNEHQVEIIHRVLQVVIIQEDGYTMQTGGGVMVDAYPTKCGKFITVTDESVILSSDEEDWSQDEGQNPHFYWGEEDAPNFRRTYR